MTSTFKHELKHWSIHAFFCTSPSFILAYAYGGYRELSALLGILLGIATTILIFATISSSTHYSTLSDEGIFRRSIRLGAKIRSGISAIELVGAIIPGLWILALPDIYAGMAAIGLVEGGFKMCGIRLVTANKGSDFSLKIADANHDFWIRNADSIIPTYLTTVIEGFIITLTMLVIALLVFIVIDLKSRFKDAS